VDTDKYHIQAGHHPITDRSVLSEYEAWVRRGRTCQLHSQAEDKGKGAYT